MTLLALHLDANGQPLERTVYVLWGRSILGWLACGAFEIDALEGCVWGGGATKSEAIDDLKRELLRHD